MVSVRLRGIYALPLAKILRDEGHEIVQPVEEVQKYLGVENNYNPPDLNLDKGNSRHEVMVTGDQEAMEDVIDLVTEEFLDAAVKRFDFNLNSIYRGRVVNVATERRAAFVDIGPTDGFLPFRNTDRRLREGDEITVKVVELPTDPGENPVLTTDISYASDYAVVIDRGVKVSNSIREKEERDRLYELGREIETDRGILWRTSARGLNEEFLKDQAEDLVEKADRIEKRSRDARAPERLHDGETATSLMMSGFTKKRLDEIRSEIAPTVSQHHKYKAADRSHDLAVEAVERLVEDEETLDGFSGAMNDIEPIQVGDSLRFSHLKPDGSSPDLGKGRVIDVEEDEIQLQRSIDRGMEGLPSQGAEYAVTSIEEGSWMIVSEYFDEDDESTGMFVNINTPVELYPWEVRYMDLCVDVIVQDGEVRVVDSGDLDDHVAEGRISSELAERAREASEDLQEELAG